MTNDFNYRSEIIGEFRNFVIFPDNYYAAIGWGYNDGTDLLILMFK